MAERSKANDRPRPARRFPLFYAPFSIPGIRQCVYFTNGQGGSFVSGEGHEEGLNYTGPVVTSTKDNHTPRNGQFIIAVARSKGTDALWKDPHESPRAGRKAECTSQGGKRKREGWVREKRATRKSTFPNPTESSTSPQDVVGTLLALEKWSKRLARRAAERI